MLIELDLNTNDAEALLRHCSEHRPNCGDFREDARLSEAMETLAIAIKDAMNPMEAEEALDHQLLDAAIRLFGAKSTAIEWLSKPMPALGLQRPIDVPLEEALSLIGRLEHGFGA